MSSRALTLAAVMLLIGCFAAKPAKAQAQNLEAGKSPSQIFAGTCSACHKSPRGLLRTVPAGSLPGFLRQHYTTSGDMASLLSAFLISNGAADNRLVGAQPKPGKDAKPEGRSTGLPDQLERFGRRLRPGAPQAMPDSEPQQAAKPDRDGLPAQSEPGRHGRNAKRLARPVEAPDATNPAAETQAPAHEALEPGSDGRKSGARQKFSKGGRPGSEDPPRVDGIKPDGPKTDASKEEAAKGEPAAEDQPKRETSRAEGARPPGDAKSESAGVDAPREAGGGSPPVLRPDPVPAVTPAPIAPAAVSAAVSSGTPEPAAAPPPPAVGPSPAAVTASAPVAPAGPPAPPISQ